MPTTRHPDGPFPLVRYLPLEGGCFPFFCLGYNGRLTGRGDEASPVLFLCIRSCSGLRLFFSHCPILLGEWVSKRFYKKSDMSTSFFLSFLVSSYLFCFYIAHIISCRAKAFTYTHLFCEYHTQKNLPIQSFFYSTPKLSSSSS